MERTDYLPLGSVVYLQNGTKKILIVGRGLLLKQGEGQVFFDYAGVMYPEGLQGNEMAYFQHESVKKIVFRGYEDDDNEMVTDRINNYREEHPEIPKG